MKIKISSINKFDSQKIIYGIYQCNYKELRKTKYGDSYINLTLHDSTGVIDGKIWDNCTHYNAKFNEGEVVVAKGVLSSYRNKKIFNVMHINRFNAGIYDIYGCSDYLVKPAVNYDVTFLWQEIFTIINRVGAYFNLVEQLHLDFKSNIIGQNSKNKLNRYLIDTYKSLKIYDVLIGSEYDQNKINHTLSYMLIFLINFKQALGLNRKQYAILLKKYSNRIKKEDFEIVDRYVIKNIEHDDCLEFDVTKKIFRMIKHVN
ncbi:MAG: hypothetical protein CMG00_02720 [Candidatus Marinimicrobia bacterium]|nr:hypothetical protein [Candidatus Neomarinimicrobiota bacterium]